MTRLSSPTWRFPSATKTEQRALKIVLCVLLALAVILFGTLGYTLIEGWSLFDSLYMTIITLATIGYGETHPLSQAGRAFTLVLIFVGVGLGTVLVGTAWQAILEGQFVRLFDRRRKMTEILGELNGHTIFCGFSRLGRIAAEELRRSGEDIVIIESNENRANDAEECGFLVVRGDATLDDSLVSAGLARASRLISLLPRDSDNLYVILTAREINPALYIVSRAEDEVGEKRLKRAGVDRMISTHRLAARKLADGLLRPNVTDFFEIAGTGDGGWKIEEIRIPAGSRVCGQTLRDLSLRQTAKVGIAGVVSPQGALEVNPSGDTQLAAGSTLIVIGWKQDIDSLEKLVLAE
jgi:voltage-gated potassium channel